MEEANEQQHHPGSWRQPYTTAKPFDDRNLKGLITDVGLSNCHLVLYSGIITLGSPPTLQRFRVDFDTAGSDIWVPSKLCDETCASSHPTWNLYDPSLSSTYEMAATDRSRNAFALEYQDGEAIKGEHAKDTLRLGDDDIRVPHQVFAHVTHIQNFATCEQEEGILGLANALTTTHGFPSLLGNILRHSSVEDGAHKVLPYNVFGMYLRSDVDDYEGIDVSNVNEKPRQSSELILGGVNQEHYLGCLKWHDLLGSVSADSNVAEGSITDFEKYWSVKMDDVKVGGTSLNKSSSLAGDLIAVLDSGSSYIVGPQAPVAHMVQLNKAKCFRMNSDDADTTDNDKAATDPQEVDCNDPDGFDGAVLNNCDDPFFSVEFIIDGEIYVLEKEDLMVHLDTLFGTVCILRVVASQGMNGWILGDAFLNKYYSAFDFENQKVGLARAAEYADDRCERDLDMDVNNFWKNVYGSDEVFDPDEYMPSLPEFPEGETDGNNEQEVGDEPETVDASDNDSVPDGSPGDDTELDDDFFAEKDDETYVLPPEPEPAPSDPASDIDNDGPSQEQVDWVDEVVDPGFGDNTQEINDLPADLDDAFFNPNDADDMAEGYEDVTDSQTNDDNDSADDNYSDDAPDISGGTPNDQLYDDTYSIAEFPEDLTLTAPAAAPFHHEAPERVEVPSPNVGVKASPANRNSISYAALSVVILVAAMLIPVAAYMLYRRRKKPAATKQQEIFQNTYKKAERKMLKEHRNLNYRNHSPRSLDAVDMALDELSYHDETFDDEELPDANGEGSGDEQDEFVLDSNILESMN